MSRISRRKSPRTMIVDEANKETCSPRDLLEWRQIAQLYRGCT
ncbi:MAG: hypothetical protein WED04_12105 [Promethearchaeati archaeon SRVP18_Atabeyarchaeia-1]